MILENTKIDLFNFNNMAKADNLFNSMIRLMKLNKELGAYEQQEKDAMFLESETHHLLPLIQAKIKKINEKIDTIWSYWFIEN